MSCPVLSGLNIPDEYAQIIELQNLLLHLSPENLEETKATISQSKFAQSEKGIIQLADNIYSILKIRHRKSDILVQLCADLYFSADPGSPLQTLKNALFATFSPMTTHVSFIIESISKKILTESELAHYFAVFSRYPGLQLEVYRALLRFGPEIQSADPELFESMFRHNEMKKELEAELNDNWAHSRCFRIKGCPPTELGLAIYFDNAKKLQEISTAPNFDLEQPIYSSVYAPLDHRENSMRPLSLAAYYNAISCFKFLLVNGAQPDGSVLECAVAAGNIEMIKILEQHKVDFSDAGATASEFFQNDILYWLLQNHYCNINYCGRYTILHTAALSNNIEAMAICFCNKTDVNAQDHDAGLRPPIYGAVERRHLDATRYLYDQPELHQDSTLLLPAAIEKRYLPLIKYFIEERAVPPSVQMPFTLVTPLHLACKTVCPDLKIVKYLALKKGVDVNAVDAFGKTPLHFATNTGYLELIQCLTSLDGIDLNVQDQDGKTPLHLAAKRGFIDVLEHLCSLSGILLNVKDTNDKTPLAIAKDCRQQEAVAFLTSILKKNRISASHSKKSHH